MKKITKRCFAVALLIGIATSASAEEVLIDVLEIVGKDKALVAATIGSELSCNSMKYGEKCVYEQAETEIVFIDGRADWITVEGLDFAPFSNRTIELLGFNPETPSFESDFTKRWDLIEGLLSLSLFKSAKNTDYAYIKSYTE